MNGVRLSTVGAVCALIGVAMFVAGIPCVVASGVQVLIPETGDAGREWIADVDSAGGTFFVGAWLGIFGGVFLLVALVGFYEALREAGPVLVLAPILDARRSSRAGSAGSVSSPPFLPAGSDCSGRPCR